MNAQSREKLARARAAQRMRRLRAGRTWAPYHRVDMGVLEIAVGAFVVVAFLALIVVASLAEAGAL